MPRFFVPTENILSEEGVPVKIKITGTDVNHIKNVLRMAEGDAFAVCDSRGTEYMCVLGKSSKTCVEADIVSFGSSDAEPKVPLVLIQGVPKGDKMELIIQKCVELGADSFIPCVTERTVVRFHSDEEREKKCVRWQRISLEAAKQCGRGRIPPVETPKDFSEVISHLGEKLPKYLLLMPYENETSVTLKETLKRYFGGDVKETERPAGIAVFIGPEGGFSAEEVETAREHGFHSVTLGKRILRTETAGLATAAAIRYELGD